MNHLINHCAKVNNAIPDKYKMSIFCNLSKVFDVINHDELITKPNLGEISANANKWFLNYLTNREHNS